jgi:hypothetical protein
MPSQFQTQLESSVVAGRNPRLLPLTHVTSWAGFIAIATAGNFSPKDPCPVYGKHLVYSFYGRPAYRLKETGVQHSLPTFAPVCFILKARAIKQAIRVLPFDSGGFAIYAPAMHSLLDRKDYELSLGGASSRRVVKKLWQTNRRYFDTKPTTTLVIDPAEVALLHYYNLISNKLAVAFDNRCSTIEVQFSAPLELDGAVEAIVVPSNVSPRAKQVAKSLKAELLVYNFDMPYYVSDFNGAVRHIVRAYLKEGKYFA